MNDTAVMTGTSDSSALSILLALVATGSVLAPPYDPGVALPVFDNQIEVRFRDEASSASSLEFEYHVTDEMLMAQLQILFRDVVSSQRSVEPEFYEALYDRRSDRYTLF